LEGIKKIQKYGIIVKSNLFNADVNINTSYVFENIMCNYTVCKILNIVSSVLSASELVLENIFSTKHLMVIMSLITVECPLVWFYYKRS